MKTLYGGIDLHANNSVVVVLDEQDQVVYRKRLPIRHNAAHAVQLVELEKQRVVAIRDRLQVALIPRTQFQDIIVCSPEDAPGTEEIPDQ